MTHNTIPADYDDNVIPAFWKLNDRKVEVFAPKGAKQAYLFIQWSPKLSLTSRTALSVKDAKDAATKVQARGYIERAKWVSEYEVSDF